MNEQEVYKILSTHLDDVSDFYTRRNYETGTYSTEICGLPLELELLYSKWLSQCWIEGGVWNNREEDTWFRRRELMKPLGALTAMQWTARSKPPQHIREILLRHGYNIADFDEESV